MHKNPVSGKWKLEKDYIDYIPASGKAGIQAQYFMILEESYYKIYHYQVVTKI